MGLSVAIAGAIVLSVLMLVLMSMSGMVDNIFSIEETSVYVTKVEDSIYNTEISLASLEVLSGSASVNFTLNNDGSEKLWDFGNFDLFIIYDSSSSKLTEELSYNGDCLGSIPNAGNWCIETITSDFLDRGLLNNGESAQILSQVSQSLGSGSVAVLVSTDNGVVNSIGAIT